jgi:hypothetical protein
VAERGSDAGPEPPGSDGSESSQPTVDGNEGSGNEGSSRLGRAGEAVMLLVLTALELVTVVVLVIYGVVNIARDPQARSVEFVNPGEQVLRHLGLLRVIGFFGSSACAVLVLLFAILGLRRSLKTAGGATEKWERRSTASLGLANLVGCVVAVVLLVQA